MILHKEHGKFMQGLEEQALREESRSHHDFSPPVRLPYTTVHYHLGGLWLPCIISY